MTITNSLNVSPINTSTVVGNGTGFTNLAYNSLASGGINIMSRDVNSNTSVNSISIGTTSTISSGGVVTMTVASTQYQILTGTTKETYVLPDATTLVNGWTYYFNNNSTDAMNIQQNGPSNLCNLDPGGFAIVYLTDNSTSAGVWDFHFGVSSGGSSGQILTNNGSNVSPTWQAAGGAATFSVNTQVFTTSGTYTPSANLAYAIVECVAGGGGGGNAPASVSQYCVGGGGGAGEYRRGSYSASMIGASQTVTIGSGGASATIGENTIFGALITCVGGGPGETGVSDTVCSVGNGGNGGTGGSGGDFSEVGGGGGGGINLNGNSVAGLGASSFFGGGGSSRVAAGGGFTNGNTGASYGSGGSGAIGVNGNSTTGGSGAPGICIVTEYIFTG